MKDRRKPGVWPWPWPLLLLLLHLCLVIGAQNRRTASSDIELHVSPSAVPQLQTGTQAAGIQEAPPRSELTSTLLLDYSSRARASNTSDLLRSMCARPRSEREAVQRCHVFGYASLANWTHLSEGLSCLSKLDSVYWQRIAPIAGMKEFFEQTLPGAQLHIDIESKMDKYNRSQSVHETDFVPLAGTTSLKSIKSNIEYGYAPEIERLAVVQQLFANSQNLESLELTFSQRGCVWDSPQPRAFDFQHGSLANATLPSLHHLKLHWYDYDGRPWRGYSGHQHRPEDMLWPFSRLTQQQVDSIPQLICWILKESKVWLDGEAAPSWLVRLYESITGEDNTPKTKVLDGDCNSDRNQTLNIDLWLERMQFAGVKSLEVDHLPSIAASRLFPALRSLSNLNVWTAEGCSRDILLDYLHHAHRPLSALHLPYVSLQNDSLSALLPALQPSSSSLQSLTLPLTITPTIKDFHRLSKLRNLSALTMHHQRALPLLFAFTPEVPRIVFPALESLTLHIPSPGAFNSRNHAQRHDLLFNRTTLTSQLQNHLYPSITPNLNRLEVLLGEWSRHWENSLIGPPVELVGRYVCERLADHSDPSRVRDRGQWQCSGGLRAPTAYGGCGGRRCGCGDCDMRGGYYDDGDQSPFVQGPKGAIVVKGNEGQGTEEDEFGRSVSRDGWVHWDDDEDEEGDWELTRAEEEMEMGQIEYDADWDY